MTKKEQDEKRELARILYMQGETQDSIAQRTGVSKNTVTRWVAQNKWAEQRAANNITRPELVNKLLRTVDKLLDQVMQSGDPSAVDGLADKLAKFSATIQKLDKKANVIDAIEVFMAFNKWLQHNAQFDPEITPELIKAINKYQNKFLCEKMSPAAEL